MDFKLNYKQYSDFINITNNVFYPLKNFVNEKEFKSILEKQKIKNKFFPFPIFFGLDKNQFNKIKKKDKLIFFYKSKKIAIIDNLKFYSLNSKKIGLVINTGGGNTEHRLNDAIALRRGTLKNKVPYCTNMSTAQACLQAIKSLKTKELEVTSLQDIK